MITKIKIFLMFIFLGLFINISFAGVVPGTINKSDYTSSNTCNTSNSPYSPSGGSCSTYCSAGSIKYYNYNCNPVISPVVCSGDPSVCTGGETTYSTCQGSYWSCDTYRTRPTTSGTLTFINYLLNNENPAYSSAGSNRKLGTDLGQSCNKWSDGTNHIAPNMDIRGSCDDGSYSYYVGGFNGSCNRRGSTDNLITSFNQLGSISRTTPTNNDSTCTVEGRYASPDDSAANVSVTGPAMSVLGGASDNWCNMQKYLKSDYGTSSNPSLPGCEFYKSKITHTAGTNPDLLEGGFDITISDTSGIREVKVELGNCETTYNFATDVNSLVASTSSRSGIKAIFSQNLVIKGISDTTYGGVTVSSLKAKLGKSRFDQCLLDGKNFLRVTVNDNARSDNDGTSHSPNTGVYVSDSGIQKTTTARTDANKWIQVDASPSSLALSGDLKRLYETTDGGSSVASSCFVSSNGGVLIDGKWRNYTLGGGIQAGDPYSEADRSDCGKCNVITTSTGSCSGSIPANAKWISPVGINPTNGQYIAYKCDGLDINSSSDCKWSCNPGYINQNGTCVSESTTSNYCRAGGPIKCTVAPSNQAETVLPTCTDGVKNGTETGVDCGGTCNACTTTPITQVSCDYPATANNTLIWDNCEGGKGGYPTLANYCSGKGMRLPTLSEIIPSGGTVPSCNGATWTSTLGSYFWDYRQWNGNNIIYTNGGTDVVNVYGRCVKDQVSYTCPNGGNLSGTTCIKSCTTTLTTSCTDGIQNGTEIGVDCGGSCNTCTVTPTPAPVVPAPVKICSGAYDSTGNDTTNGKGNFISVSPGQRAYAGGGHNKFIYISKTHPERNNCNYVFQKNEYIILPVGQRGGAPYGYITMNSCSYYVSETEKNYMIFDSNCVGTTPYGQKVYPGQRVNTYAGSTSGFASPQENFMNTSN